MEIPAQSWLSGSHSQGNAGRKSPYRVHAFSPAVAAEFQWRTVSSVSTGCSVLILTCLVRGDEAYHPPNRLVGLRRTVVSDIRAERPDWQLFRDGCPGGESPLQVVARALIAL